MVEQFRVGAFFLAGFVSGVGRRKKWWWSRIAGGVGVGGCLVKGSGDLGTGYRRWWWDDGGRLDGLSWWCHNGVLGWTRLRCRSSSIRHRGRRADGSWILYEARGGYGQSLKVPKVIWVASCFAYLVPEGRTRVEMDGIAQEHIVVMVAVLFFYLEEAVACLILFGLTILRLVIVGIARNEHSW